MIELYAALLKLYPSAYRSVFAEEMMEVFGQSRAEARKHGMISPTVFYLREFAGIVLGATRERLFGCATFGQGFGTVGGPMKRSSERRFPVFSIVMMMFAFFCLLELIAKGDGISQYLLANPEAGAVHLGNSIRFWPSGWRLVSSILTIFGVSWLSGVSAWLVAYAMRRTGAQRLDDIWPGERLS